MIILEPGDEVVSTAVLHNGFCLVFTKRGHCWSIIWSEPTQNWNVANIG